MEVTVVAFHQITETVLADDFFIRGQHGGHDRPLQADGAFIQFKIAFRHIPSRLIPDIEDADVGDLGPANGSTDGKLHEVQMVQIRDKRDIAPMAAKTEIDVFGKFDLGNRVKQVDIVIRHRLSRAAASS